MKSTVLSASRITADAIESGRFKVSGSTDCLLEYFEAGVKGKSGFMVEGSLERFAEYFLLSASGVSGALTVGAGSGASGFMLKGDHEFAWATKYFESAASGVSGFLVEKVE